MATFELYRIKLATGGSAPFLVDRFVYVKWNDSTNDFQVDLHDETDVYLSTEVSGPGLIVNEYIDYNYSFIDINSNLISFTEIFTTFPYSLKIETPVIVDVCGIAFYAPDCFSTNATNENADGTIEVFAEDSYSAEIVKYNIGSDFDYLSGGQVGTTFTGLVPGTYAIYARNSNSCRTVINITVGLTETYEVRYRLEFHDLKSFPVLGANRKYRVDILDYNYTGDVNELIGGSDDPVTIDWSSSGSDENPFGLSVVASEMNISILSKTDEEYIDFYTTDEKQFKAVVYVYESGYQLFWSGFLTPMLYSESYVSKKNYDITLTFTDGVADLSTFPFSDDSNNQITKRIPLLNAISYILNKTGLSLGIWESVNIYAAVMASGTNDSCLEQGFIDPKVYLNDDGTSKDCLVVLQYIVDFLGCKVYQSKGLWHIDLVSEKTASLVPTRKFDSDLNALGGGDENPRIMLRIAGAVPPKVTLAEQSGVMNIAETFGRIALTYDLGIEKENNLLDYGNFEDEDVENGQLKGWQVDDSLGGLATYGLEKLAEPRGDSEYAFFVDFAACAIGQNIIKLQSLPFEYDYPGVGTFQSIKVSFDVYTRALFTKAEIYLDWKVTINGGIYVLPRNYSTTSRRALGTAGFLNDLIDDKYNRVFISDSLTWKTIEFEFPIYFVSLNGVSSDGPIQIELRISSNPIYDYANTTALKTESVDSLNNSDTIYFNKRRKVKDTINSKDVIRIYEIERSSDGESLPDIVRPNSFSTASPYRKNYVWKLKETVDIEATDKNWLQNILIDNVRMQYLPEYGVPIETIEVIEVPNEKVKPVLEKTLVHGDLLTPPLDNNYSLISKAYLTEEDGTPIYGNWARRGVTENYSITQLLGKMIRGQFQERRRKLTGSLDCPDLLPTFWNTLHEVRTGRVFQFMSLKIYLRMNMAEFSAVETLSGGDPLDESVGGDVGEIEPPVETRVHVAAFSSAFN